MMTTAVYSQDILCPDDVIVHLFDLDTDYESYGEPQTTGPDMYNVSQEITIIDNSCQGQYGQIASIKYTLENQATGSALDNCTQLINVTRPIFADWTFPADYDTNQSTLEDLKPTITGYLEPYEFLQDGETNFLSAYDDVIINAGDGVKILRTWTLLDWCTAKVEEHVQIIKAAELTSIGSGSIELSSCSGSVIEVENIKLLTDVTGYTVDYGNCAATTTDLTSFVNCVANNNDIPSANNFFLEIEKGEPLNGVSTLDMLLIQRHILNRKPIEKDCSIIAADVNSDGIITAIDMIEMRKLILGIYSELPNSPSWKFYVSEVISESLFVDNTDLKFAKSEFPLTNLEITAVKVGDVNGTAR